MALKITFAFGSLKLIHAAVNHAVKCGTTCYSYSSHDKHHADGESAITMRNSKMVSIVFPCYNEEEGSGQGIEDFFASGYVIRSWPGRMPTLPTEVEHAGS